MLSHDLQELIGIAVVDVVFRAELLADPRKALTGFGLNSADRRAANAIQGARSLAEYAARLEQRVSRGKQPESMPFPWERPKPAPRRSRKAS